MPKQISCPVCDLVQITFAQRKDGADVEVFDCPICGEFQLSRTLSTELQRKTDEEVEEKYAPRWVLSAAIRNQYERGESLELSTTTVETLLETARIPDDPFESINLLLRHIQDRVDSPGQAAAFNQRTDFSLVYAQGPKEFEYYIKKAQELGLIEPGPKQRGYRLGLEGWRRLEELNQNPSDSDQAFVAMWFGDEVKSAYTEGFKPALEKSGYSPIRIDMKEHNEKIDDRIIAEIRESGLVVADFTGQRGGVYFEAGFAKGLGIPVIWTCHKDEVNNLHFDTRQYNHIVWSKPADLKTQLIDRIAATFVHLW